jgi:hypothetical protein
MASGMNDTALQHAVRRLTDPAASEWGGAAGRGASADRWGRAWRRPRRPLGRPAAQRAPPRPPAALLERRKALDAIKDSVELLHTAQYPGFLALCFEPLCAQLTSTQPQFERDSELQLLRHGALEALSRLPANEAFKPHASKLCDVALGVSRKGAPADASAVDAFAGSAARQRSWRGEARGRRREHTRGRGGARLRARARWVALR